MRFKQLSSMCLMCAVLLSSSLAGRAFAQDDDPWLGTDKGKHFGVSLALASGGYAASMLLVDAPWQRAALGGGFAFSLGIAKEVYDATGHGDPSLRDLTWDLIGCALGAGTAALIDYAFRSRATERARLQPPRAAAW